MIIKWILIIDIFILYMYKRPKGNDFSTFSLK